MNKKRREEIIAGKVTDAKDSEIYSVFIKLNKQRAKRTINHYVQNLPTTYTPSKEIVKVEKKIRDIRDGEVKNTVMSDPMVVMGAQNPIITSDQDTETKKEYYYVPKFFPVKNSQRLRKAYDDAYAAYLKKTKGFDLLSAHQGANQAGLEALNKYADWVFKQNKMLVAKYPSYWSENKPEEKKQIEAVKPETFFTKMKKWITNDKK
ncbi:MAG: hypothetical protein WAT79_08545 [Saprospiraceae bacterium]